jgi:hypothetical protein
MGKKGRQKKGTITSVAKATGDKPAYTVDQLLDRVDEYMEDFQLELAHKFATRALSMAPNDVRALEAMAVVLLESGDPDNAYQVKPSCCSSLMIYLSGNALWQFAIGGQCLPIG